MANGTSMGSMETKRIDSAYPGHQSLEKTEVPGTSSDGILVGIQERQESREKDI